MAALKSADSLIAEISNSIRNELVSTLAPIVRRIAETASELEAALAAPSGVKRRGRPGRKPKSATSTGGRKSRVRTRRGAMRQTIMDILAKTGAPMKLSAIRDEILKLPAYRGRQPAPLYTQIVITIQKIKEIGKTPDGTYTLKKKK